MDQEQLEPLKGKKHVIVIDELIDTGATIDAILKVIPHAKVVACMAKKKADGLIGCDIIPNVWLVGYGLDISGEKRGWPHLFAKNDKEWFRPEHWVAFRKELRVFLGNIKDK